MFIYQLYSSLLMRMQGVRSRLFARPAEDSEKGQGLVEYALILVLVAVVVIVIMALAGNIIAAWFGMINICVRSPGDNCNTARALMESGDYQAVVAFMETLFP